MAEILENVLFVFPSKRKQSRKSTVVFSILTRIVILSVLLLKMAAIGMVQMLIEAAEYLDRRERGTVT